MSKTMLIDAAHSEEVRVCVTENGKVEDFDFESSSRKPLRGNIYLARVTRVEPSLQAAFVEYGGNRHGFLAFNEIHPDYYQIPVSDREALQAAEAEEAALAAELDLIHRGGDEDGAESDLDDAASELDDEAAYSANEEDNEDAADDAEVEAQLDDADATDDGSTTERVDTDGEEAFGEDPVGDADDALNLNVESSDSEAEDNEDAQSDFAPATDDADEAGEPMAFAIAPFPTPTLIAELESEAAEAGQKQNSAREARKARAALLERYKEARRKRARLIRNYKIQEVIKRRQILLVQVVKEERGNKGAALTTYLSLAGRYCVLMPNTARGGGISRKIPNASDRKRLRRIVDGLDVSGGMGLIIRTAGAKRTKTEIKRDYDYLTRLWENIRALTLESIAPCLIYEEASLIKRAIRDLYDKDIGKVLVEGDDGYREAKDFMKMLMPSHAKNVQPYRDKAPLFVRSGVENQLDAMYQPVVRLKSGGYIVINQTEALIAIDVNSGKATRERNIEQTALRTNLEAAEETARQCRLRDLAGLLVIDFIDMEENRNNRAVERRLKDALKHDRARIQVGRISSFGLLEMSRQRRRSGIVDGTTHACPTCNGAGAVRSHEMAALRILRAIESEASAGRAGVIAATASLDVTLYILNFKRDWLKRIEAVHNVSIEITADPSKAGDQYEIEKRGSPRPQRAEHEAIRADSIETTGEDIDSEAEPEDLAASNEGDADADEKPAKRRRRRRRRKRDDDGVETAESAHGESSAEDASETESESEDGETDRLDASDDDAGDRKKRRRRGRRGGRRKRRAEDEAQSAAEPGEETLEQGERAHDHEGGESENADANSATHESSADEPAGTAQHQMETAEADAHQRGDAAEVAVNGSSRGDDEAFANGADAEDGDAEPIEPAAATPDVVDAASDTSEEEAPIESDPAPTAEEVAARLKSRKSSRKGWWSRALGG